MPLQVLSLPGRFVLFPGWLDDQLLLQVAAENNLSRTAFFAAQHDHHDRPDSNLVARGSG
jgi:hypothetical protein